VNALISFSKGRRWSIAFQVVLGVVAFSAIVVMVNYLSARHFQRFHWSERGSLALTPQTLALLQAMTNRIEITVFFDSEAELFTPVSQLLEEYLSASPHLSVRKVDLYRNPTAAQAVRTRFNLPADTDDNLVIFHHANRTRVITEPMLVDKDYEQSLVDGQLNFRPRNRAFKGELMFSSALVDVTSTRQLKAYFLTGHGEHSPTSNTAQMGYAAFADLLTLNNVHHDVLNLGGSGEIPRDCDLLIIAGPQDRFLPTELDRLEQYLNQGGRLFVMFNVGPVLTGTELEQRLEPWGVIVGRNLVEDAQHGIEGRPEAFTTSRYGQHPIVDPLRDVRLQVLSPRTIAAQRGQNPGLAGATLSELVFTSTNAVVYTQFRDGQVSRTGRDPVGEVPLAVAVEKGGLPGVSTQHGGVTRIVVTGDSFMFSNLLLDYLGNRDFANQCLNWLLDRSELMAGIGPRPMQEYQLALTPAQLSGVRWVLIGGLPVAALLVGFLVWLRRRS